MNLAPRSGDIIMFILGGWGGGGCEVCTCVVAVVVVGVTVYCISPNA